MPQQEIDRRKEPVTAQQGGWVELLQHIFDSGFFIIFSVDQQCRYTAYNPRHAELMHALYGADIQIGQPVLECVTVEQDRQTLRRGLARALAGEEFEETGWFGGEEVPARYIKLRYLPTLEHTRIIGASIFAEEVSEQEKVKQELKHYLALFRSSLDAMQEGVLLLDRDFRYLYVNLAAEKQGRRPKEELLGRTVMECWPGIEETDFFKLEAQVLREQRPAQIESSFIFPDGELHWFEWRIQPVEMGLLVITADITARKRAELANVEDRKLLSRILDTIPGQIWTAQPDGLIDFVSQGWLDYCGLAAEEALGNGWIKILEPRDAEKNIAIWRRAVAEKKIFENVLRLRRADGAFHWFYARAVPAQDADGHIIKWYGLNTDINQQKEIEEALQASHRLLGKLGDQLPGVIFTLEMRADGSFCMPFCSAGIQNIYGCKPEDVREDIQPILRATSSEGAAGILAGLAQSARELTPYVRERQVQLPGQAPRSVWIHAMPEAQPAGNVLWYGYITDISELKQKDAAIRESEERLRLFFDTAPDAILFTDPVMGEILAANKAAERMTGWSEAELIRLGRDSIIDPQDTRLPAAMEERAQAGFFHGELTFVRKDGSRFPVELASSAFTDALGQARASLFAHDITRRKRDQAAVADALEFNRQVLESAPVGICIYNAQGQCISANASAARITHLTVEKLLAHNYNTLEAFKLEGMYEAAQQALRRGRQVSLVAHGVHRGAH